MADHIRLRGRVVSARHYMCTAGSSWLHLVLAQQPAAFAGHHGRPGITARRLLGTGPAAQMAAASLANHLRAGDVVVVWADAIGVCPHTGHFRLHGCSQVERLDMPPEPEPDPQPVPLTTRRATQLDAAQPQPQAAA